MRRIVAIIVGVAVFLGGLILFEGQDWKNNDTSTTVAEAATEEPVEPTEEPTAEPTVEPTAEPTAEPTVEPTPEPLERSNDVTGKIYIEAQSLDAAIAYMRQMDVEHVVDTVECVNYAASMVVDIDDPRIIDGFTAYDLYQWQYDENEDYTFSFDLNGDILFAFSEDESFELSARDDKAFEVIEAKDAYASWKCSCGGHEAIAASSLRYRGFPKSTGYRQELKVANGFDVMMLKCIVPIRTDVNRYDWVIVTCDGSVPDASKPNNPGNPHTEPTDKPTPVPTDKPTPVPTAEPTSVPTAEPTPVPTAEPTPVPTAEPTPVPTAEPTSVPTAEPTPSFNPEPTADPTPKPSFNPEPTADPTPKPTPTPNFNDEPDEPVASKDPGFSDEPEMSTPTPKPNFGF